MDEGSVQIRVRVTAFCTSVSLALEVAIWTVAVSPSALTAATDARTRDTDRHYLELGVAGA